MGSLEFSDGKRLGSTFQGTLEISLFLDQCYLGRPSKLVNQAVRHLSGFILPTDEFEQINGRNREYFSTARSYYKKIQAADETGLQAKMFLVSLSTFVHEHRHAHDLLGTRIGQGILLNSRECYLNAGMLLESLKSWQMETGKPIPLPLPKDLQGLETLPSDTKELILRSFKVEETENNIMNSQELSPSGLSVRHLLETSAINIQLDFTRMLFGDKAALVVKDAIAKGSQSRLYYEARNEVRDLFISKGFIGYDFDKIVNYLIWCSLSGIFPKGGNVRDDTIHPVVLFESLVEHVTRTSKNMGLIDCQMAVQEFCRRWDLETPENAAKHYSSVFSERVVRAKQLAERSKHSMVFELLQSYGNIKNAYDRLYEIAIKHPYLLCHSEYYITHLFGGFFPSVLIKLLYTKSEEKFLFRSYGYELMNADEWQTISTFAVTLNLFTKGRLSSDDLITENSIYDGLVDGDIWGYRFRFNCF
ncbi:MAG: hypothetical protein DHS20C13_24110 [Thermodesulfobacteriota bacterium]|nr:MAG: hypothetical protein DHS20C13_24110 [Thermodesulfobacteriota bacterium]